MAAKIRRVTRLSCCRARQSGRTGEVFEVRPPRARRWSAGINLVKRHQKQTQAQGRIIEGVRDPPVQHRGSSARTASRPARFQDSGGCKKDTHRQTLGSRDRWLRPHTSRACARNTTKSIRVKLTEQFGYAI